MATAARALVDCLLREGIDHLLEKPYSIKDVVAVLEACLSSRQRERPRTSRKPGRRWTRWVGLSMVAEVLPKRNCGHGWTWSASRPRRKSRLCKRLDNSLPLSRFWRKTLPFSVSWAKRSKTGRC